MAAVAIKGKPYQPPSLKSTTRTQNKITITWEYPSSIKDETNAYRAQSVTFKVTIYNTSGKAISTINKSLGLSLTSYSFTLGTGAYRYDGYIYFTNSKGSSTGTRITDTFYNPRSASIGAFSYDDVKTLSVTMTAPQYEYRYPRSTVEYIVTRSAVINNVTQATTTVKDSSCIGWDNNDTRTWTYNLTGAECWGLQQTNDYILYTIKARSAGLGGSSQYSAWTTKSFYFAFPAIPTIQTLTVDYTTKNLQVGLYDNYTAQRPTEKIRAQVAYADKEANITTWHDVGEEFDRPVRSIQVLKDEITPERGQHVWIRLKATCQSRSLYSAVKQLSDSVYFTPLADSGDAPAETVAITSTTNNDDGSSIDVVIGYPTSTTYNACELAYSTDMNAWKSTKEPDTFTMPDTYWKDAASKSSTHANTSTVRVRELDENTIYFFRARRIVDGESDTYTQWSAMASANTLYGTVDGIVFVPSKTVVTVGEPFDVSWYYADGIKQQSAWINDASTNSSGLAVVDGSITSARISFSAAGEHELYVRCYFSNYRSMASATTKIKVVNPPSVKFSGTPPKTVTSLPATFTVYTPDYWGDTAGSNVSLKIVSKGIKVAKPDGIEQQYRGDIVAQNDGEDRTTLTFNDATALWDGGEYQLQAVADYNGIEGEMLTHDFNVKYAASIAAPDPANVSIVPTADKGAEVTASALQDGATWDLYRTNEDGRSFLIAQNLNAGDTATDAFAPYRLEGECFYTILAKNACGQFDYRRYEYTANDSVLRFDWDNTFVELPYNLSFSDENDKQFEQQVYLDGTQRGAWGASVIRESSLSTDTIFIKDADTISKIRDLARYQGAVFVRTPLGQAYTANVEVDEMSKDYDTSIVAVSFTCTEIDLTEEYGAVSEEA